MTWRSLDSLIEETETPANAARGIWNRADIEGRLARETKDEQVAPADLTRNDLIRWYWTHRWTMKEIAEEVGVSRQRVHQILTRDDRKD